MMTERDNAISEAARKHSSNRDSRMVKVGGLCLMLSGGWIANCH